MLIVLAVHTRLVSAFGVTIMYTKVLTPATVVLATLAILAAAAPTGMPEDGANFAAPEAVPDAQAANHDPELALVPAVASNASPDLVLFRKELDDGPEPVLVHNM